MPKRSAGLIMYRLREGELQVFLVHPGGPFWAHKDMGAWTIPKGEYPDTEDPLNAARREFREETGFNAEGLFQELGEIRQAGGKIVTAWAFEGDCDPANLISNLCEIEWPPRSQTRIQIPEVDRGEWFSIAQAHERILNSQRPLLEGLALRLLDSSSIGSAL
ncbi:MAG: NUDIX domain-containing protein [Edaphobacter sp.]